MFFTYYNVLKFQSALRLCQNKSVSSELGIQLHEKSKTGEDDSVRITTTQEREWSQGTVRWMTPRPVR